MYSRLRLYFSSRMRSVCVSLPFCVTYLRFHFRSRTRSLWVWVTLCRLSAFPYTFHLRSVSVFPFCVPFLRSFSLFVTQCALSIRSDSCYCCLRSFSVCFLFFYHLMVPFKAHLIFFFLRNSMQFLSRWSCISKRKTTFEDILKCYQSHSNQGLNKLRRVRCWNGDVLEISLLVNLSFWLEIWSVFYVQWIQKWLKCVLIQKRRLL